METKERPDQKKVRILKCVKCGKEYIFDSDNRICPECHGKLKEDYR